MRKQYNGQQKNTRHCDFKGFGIANCWEHPIPKKHNAKNHISGSRIVFLEPIDPSLEKVAKFICFLSKSTKDEVSTRVEMKLDLVEGKIL